MTNGMGGWPRHGLAALAALLLAGAAQAHPLAPALLELREVAPERFAVLWRTPVVRTRGVDVVPRLPCADATAPESRIEGNEALVARWTVQCTGPLAGRSIAVEGLAASGTDVILRIEPLAAAPVAALLTAERAAFVVPAARTAGELLQDYFALGVQHLLTGLDHAAFVVGLLLLVAGARARVVTVTAFTVGHSVTLALATLGWLRLDPVLAELGIALSIVIVAWLALRPALPRPAGTAAAMAGGFGLLHGLGFAGALAEAGLPAGDIPLALLAFNAGIETGQLLLVLAWLALGATLRALTAGQGVAAARVVPSYVIGSLAACACLERALVLFV